MIGIALARDGGRAALAAALLLIVRFVADNIPLRTLVPLQR